MHPRRTLQSALALSVALSPPASAEESALFLGNSYTGTNDLPAMVEALATSGGHTFSRDSRAPGGWSLGLDPDRHDTDPESLGKIAARGWSFVVLQEQSQIPTIPLFQEGTMYPGARTLDAAIHEASPCARTVLFLTWGREDGGQQCVYDVCSDDFEDFDAMQASLTEAYAALGEELGAIVAPVGEAWGAAMAADAGIALFSSDGSHPSIQGTYLAACVFYATLFEESPEGLSFTGGLTSGQAALFQAIAWQTVSEGDWGSVSEPIEGCADVATPEPGGDDSPPPGAEPTAMPGSSFDSGNDGGERGCGGAARGAEAGAGSLLGVAWLLGLAARRRFRGAFGREGA